MKTTVNATLTKSIKKYEDYHYLVKSSSDPPIGTILLQYFFFHVHTSYFDGHECLHVYGRRHCLKLLVLM